MDAEETAEFERLEMAVDTPFQPAQGLASALRGATVQRKVHLIDLPAAYGCLGLTAGCGRWEIQRVYLERAVTGGGGGDVFGHGGRGEFDRLTAAYELALAAEVGLESTRVSPTGPQQGTMPHHVPHGRLAPAVLQGTVRASV